MREELGTNPSRRTVVAWMLAIGTAAVIPTAAYAARGGDFYGYIVHVSTENIKVYDPKSKQTLSFVIVPKFKNIVSSDGKTTYQMAQLKRNMYVDVRYDQNAMGIRHADKITVLRASGQPVKSMKS